MSLSAYAFISYQTSDKIVAGKLKAILSDIGINGFLAHEDIHVSEEWRLKILEELSKADIFIPLLSNNYLTSPWCIQESGIAAYRNGLTIVPLSLDGTIPQAFISHIQSTKIDPENFYIGDLLPGIIKYDFSIGIAVITELIGNSRSYRGAEANFRLILPYLERMEDDQFKSLLEAAISNGQVHHAGLCANQYIPPLLKSHGHLLSKDDREFLKDICEKYAD